MTHRQRYDSASESQSFRGGGASGNRHRGYVRMPGVGLFSCMSIRTPASCHASTRCKMVVTTSVSGIVVWTVSASRHRRALRAPHSFQGLIADRPRSRCRSHPTRTSRYVAGIVQTATQSRPKNRCVRCIPISVASLGLALRLGNRPLVLRSRAINRRAS